MALTLPFNPSPTQRDLPGCRFDGRHVRSRTVADDMPAPVLIPFKYSRAARNSGPLRGSANTTRKRGLGRSSREVCRSVAISPSSSAEETAKVRGELPKFGGVRQPHRGTASEVRPADRAP